MRTKNTIKMKLMFVNRPLKNTVQTLNKKIQVTFDGTSTSTKTNKSLWTQSEMSLGNRYPDESTNYFLILSSDKKEKTFSTEI